MSPHDLTLHRLSATIGVDGSEGGRPDLVEEATRRVIAVQRLVAGGQLQRAWADLDLPAGHWCVRRLDLSLDLDLDRSDLTLGRHWAQGMVAAVRRAVVDGTADVVHFRHDLDAAADLVAGVATGRVGHAWAWRQLGLLRAETVPGTAAPGEVIRAVLLRRPERVVPVLVRAMNRCGFPALDRALGSDGWVDLAAAAWTAAGGVPTVALDTALSGEHGWPPSRSSEHGSAPTGWHVVSELAAGIGRSRLAPAPATLNAWAVLVGVEADPGLPRRASARTIVESVRRELSARLPAGSAKASRAPEAEAPAGPAIGPTLPPPGAATRDQGAAPSGTGPPVPDPLSPGPAHVTELRPGPPTTAAHRVVSPVPAERDVPRPERDLPRPGDAVPPGRRDVEAGEHVEAEEDSPAGRATPWAGLPFLLATAGAAGLPDRLFRTPALTGRPVWWCVHAAGRAMTGAELTDAGLLALAGLPAARSAAVLASPEADNAEQVAVDRLARDWAAVTAARVHAAAAHVEAGAADATLDPVDVVRRVCRRAGHVVAEPGWIEVHLPLPGVDLAVRRAGLDADPGWVGWLGAVVRYVYE